MKRFLTIVFVIALVATPINDVGRYLSAQYTLSNATDAVMNAAVTAIRTPGARGTNAGGLAAVEAAQAAGVELYGYQATGADVTVWTRVAVKGTWVIGPFKAFRADKPLSTPFFVTQKQQQILQ